MSWFLFEKKKRPRSTRRTSKPTSTAKAWDPQRTLMGLKALSVAVVLVAGAYGWSRSERYLTRYVTDSRHDTRIVSQDVIFDQEPAGMSLLLEDLKEAVVEQIGVDPLRNDGLQRAAVVLARNPWVAQVHEVRRRGDGKILVSADIRQPLAVVKSADGYHLVDAKGVRLPGLYLEHQLGHMRQLLIIGVALQPGEEGEVWPGDDLQAGLALVPWLVDKPYAQQITAVDVSDHDTRGRTRLALHTAQGMVRWGLAPGCDQAVELDTAGKLLRLEHLYAQKGSIDADGKIVDIYGPAIFVHQATLRQTTYRDAHTRQLWGR